MLPFWQGLLSVLDRDTAKMKRSASKRAKSHRRRMSSLRPGTFRSSTHLAVECLEERVTPSLLTPAQIRKAYGIDNIQFPGSSGSITGDGTGQTIAIIAQETTRI